MAAEYDADDAMRYLMSNGDGLVLIAPNPGPGVFLVQTSHGTAAQVFIPWPALEELMVQLMETNSLYKAGKYGPAAD